MREWFSIEPWSATPVGCIVSPIALAVLGYALISLRSGHAASLAFAGVALAIGVGVNEFANRISQFAELGPDALCVKKLRSLRAPQRNYIAYTDVNRLTRRGQSVDIAYAGFNFFTRAPGERHDVVRVDAPDEFIEALQRRIEAQTGGCVPVTTS